MSFYCRGSLLDGIFFSHQFESHFKESESNSWVDRHFEWLPKGNGARNCPQMSTSKLKSYSFVLAVCIGAGMLSWILGAPSSCFHLAIVICCLYGGKRAGIVGTGIAIVSFDYFFLPPHFSLRCRAFRLSPLRRFYRDRGMHQPGHCRQTAGRQGPPRSGRAIPGDI